MSLNKIRGQLALCTQANQKDILILVTLPLKIMFSSVFQTVQGKLLSIFGSFISSESCSLLFRTHHIHAEHIIHTLYDGNVHTAVSLTSLQLSCCFTKQFTLVVDPFLNARIQLRPHITAFVM